MKKLSLLIAIATVLILSTSAAQAAIGHATAYVITPVTITEITTSSTNGVFDIIGEANATYGIVVVDAADNFVTNQVTLSNGSTSVVTALTATSANDGTLVSGTDTITIVGEISSLSDKQKAGLYEGTYNVIITY